MNQEFIFMKFATFFFICKLKSVWTTDDVIAVEREGGGGASLNNVCTHT